MKYYIKEITKPKSHGFDFEQKKIIALRLLEAINIIANNDNEHDKFIAIYPPKCTTVIKILATKEAILKVGKRLGIKLLEDPMLKGRDLCRTCSHYYFLQGCQCKKLLETGNWLSKDKGLKETQNYILADNATCSQFKQRK